MNSDTGGLGQEWITLQNNHEQYERASLFIKLLAILLCALGFALALHEVVTILLLLVLWIQESIFRTSQARLGVRLLCIEQAIRSGESLAFQLHSEWQASRPGTFGLIAEYAASAVRPTVAYPYLPLLLLIVLLVLLAGS